MSCSCKEDIGRGAWLRCKVTLYARCRYKHAATTERWLPYKVTPNVRCPSAGSGLLQYPTIELHSLSGYVRSVFISSANAGVDLSQDGPVFHGKSFGARANISGEAVFTTSLVGYPESLTDPSYRGQILVFTQPLIGNYGVPSDARDEYGLLKYFESPNMQAVGVVVADVAEQYSHWTAVESLGEWCAREGVPAISGVDTRAIVTFLREQGSSLARITIGEEYDADQDEAFVDPEQINLVRKVSTKAPFHVSCPNGDLHVAVIDCGVKENILRSLVRRGASATVFPFDYPIHKVAHHFDGIFMYVVLRGVSRSFCLVTY